MIDKAYEDARLVEERFIDEKLRGIPRTAHAHARGYTGEMEAFGYWTGDTYHGRNLRPFLLHEIKKPTEMR